MIAALFVEKDGPYFGLSDVDPWDIDRDARQYAGPFPVVAHPPCARWCQLAPVNHARYGTPIGDDGGCFEAALSAVRKFGGVLEHPAFTIAWRTFGIPNPHLSGGWQRVFDGGWVAHVEQRNWGHEARKGTWLYAYGMEDPPSVKWGRGPAPLAWIGGPINGFKKLERRASSETPIEFRDLLLTIARLATK